MTTDEAVTKIVDALKLTPEESLKLVEKAISGNEITDTFPVEEWLEKRLFPRVVFINETEYAKMCIDALKILNNTAATDYGGSRQRDLGQLWADMTRGYLGELAFVKFLEEKYKIESKLGHEVGQLSDYPPMDIHEIKKPNDSPRPPRIKIGIKTTKINGIWLDIPGDQFEHSDIHVLVKVASGRDHLFAFFKNLSVFKDKVLKKGEEIGSLSKEESNDIYDNLPSFRPIPAYICGFVTKETKYNRLSYEGKAGRINYTITAWNGPIGPTDLTTITTQLGIRGKIKFEGIGEFAHDSGYLFNAGNLFWSEEDWDKIIKGI